MSSEVQNRLFEVSGLSLGPEVGLLDRGCLVWGLASGVSAIRFKGEPVGRLPVGSSVQLQSPGHRGPRALIEVSLAAYTLLRQLAIAGPGPSTDRW